MKLNKIKLTETITPRSCYMLRNDGKLFECKFHPYIIRGTKDTDSMILNDNLNTYALEWFLNHSNNPKVTEGIKEYFTNIENISLLRDINELVNKEFCKVRTSNIKAPYGFNGDTYFRIYPSNFNWFNLIWNVVNNNKNFITTVTICTDEQSTGKTICYNHHGMPFNKMPVDKFITLSGNPIIERLNESIDGEDLLEDITDERNKQLALLDKVKNLLINNGFEEKQKLNGVAFTKFINEDNFEINAQMYIDTSKWDYSCYINYNDDTDINTNFSMAGEDDSILSAAEKLIDELNNISIH